VETGYCGVTSASHASRASDGIQTNENVWVATVRGGRVCGAGIEGKVLLECVCDRAGGTGLLTLTGENGII